MPKRRLTPPPDDFQWCIVCRKVIGDHHGWYGGQCFCGRESLGQERRSAVRTANGSFGSKADISGHLDPRVGNYPQR